MYKKNIILILLLFFSIGQNSFAGVYEDTIQQAVDNESVKKQILPLLQKDALGYFSVVLHASNFALFEKGIPKCDLSDKNNICFHNISIVEIMVNIAKQEQILIDTTPFYKWKEAVLRGENIQPYLENLLDKNFYHRN